MKNILLSIIITFLVIKINAQTKNTTPIFNGSIKGLVIDSLDKKALESATLSVYLTTETKLINYQITNNQGLFSIGKLPKNTPLKLKVNYIGYASSELNFTIPSNLSMLDIGIIRMKMNNISLKEVIVELPPIQMNGDTLEINPSAFSLDSNAVVEDLLKKVPNITIWGDGVITVNGKEVKSLLVNGKSFFGESAKIAIQNIPKNVVEKIQVYNKDNNESNLSSKRDSLLEINIKLKKGKESGYFGKIGLGLGTNKRFDTDGNINAFNNKTQISLGGNYNNVNKLANSLNVLLENSTYKGNGTDIDYQPDFRMDGITTPKTLGINFKHSLLKNPYKDNKKELNFGYFRLEKESFNASSLRTITTGNFSDITDEKDRIRTLKNVEQHINGKYDNKNENHWLSINQKFTRQNSETLNSTTFNSFNSLNSIISTSSTQINDQSLEDVFNFNIYYKQLGDKRKYNGLTTIYNVNYNDKISDLLNKTTFNSFIDSDRDQRFDRKFNRDIKTLNQSLVSNFEHLKSIIFGKNNLKLYDFSFRNRIDFLTQRNKDYVEDFNVTINDYQINENLTNNTQTKTFKDFPEFSIRKNTGYKSNGVIQQNSFLVVSLKQAFIVQENKSIKDFQNIVRNYSRFIPEAKYETSKYLTSKYTKTLTFNYLTDITIPEINQIVPLVDSTNLYMIMRGGINLKESLMRKFRINYNYRGIQKNSLNYFIEFNGGFIQDKIIDSTFISSDNIRTIFLTNAKGAAFGNTQFSVKKAYKFDLSQVQLELNHSFKIDRNPNYLNGIYNFSINSSNSTFLSLNYSYKEKLAIENKSMFTTFKVSQKTFNTNFSGSNFNNQFSTSYLLYKSLSINTNFIYDRNIFNSREPISAFICNSSLIYRALKSRNLEFKFSALDIFKQNNNVINIQNQLSFTSGTQNVLTQYFMTSLSYYPRKFGK